MYVVINELEKDVLREIISIGLASAADSFSDFSSDQVLLDVPDIKIIETRVFPDVVDEFNSVYTVIRSDIGGDLAGKTFMLYSEGHIGQISAYCHNSEELVELHQERVLHLLQEISFTITKALCAQLEKILNVSLVNQEAESIFKQEQKTIQYIVDDLPEGQPFLITIKTHFRKLFSILELPMLVVFDAQSISRLLHILRRSNLYDYKFLKKK
jgi:chemotaxis protein CheC